METSEARRLIKLFTFVPEALFLDVSMDGHDPPNGSLNKSLDFRLLYRYIYIYIVQKSKYS